MVYNGFFQAIQDNLVGILGGGVSLTLIVKIISDAVSGKKLNKTIGNFGGLLSNNGNAILKIFNDFKEEVKTQVVDLVSSVEVLLEENKKEKIEKEFFQDMLITTLSVANVPVSQRKEFYSAISKVSSISEAAKASLLSSIEADEQKVVVSNAQIDNALNLLEDEEQEGV